MMDIIRKLMNKYGIRKVDNEKDYIELEAGETEYNTMLACIEKEFSSYTFVSLAEILYYLGKPHLIDGESFRMVWEKNDIDHIIAIKRNGYVYFRLNRPKYVRLINPNREVSLETLEYGEWKE